jgi:hypothetical protein
MEQRPSVGFGEYVRLTATSWVSSVTGALLHRLSADLGRFIESPFGVGWSHGVQTNMSEWDGCGSAARLASSVSAVAVPTGVTGSLRQAS